MEEYIVHTYFSDVKRCKYIYEYSIPRDHSFSSFKASIANKCTVELGGLNFEGQQFLILSACWHKPHFFIINTKNCNIMWTEGIPNDEITFVKQYSQIISLSEWVKTLQKLAKHQVLVEWAQCGQYIKPKAAFKKFKPVTQ